MRSRYVALFGLVCIAVLLVLGCASAPAPSPTAAPKAAEPTKAAAPAAAQPAAPTSAPQAAAAPKVDWPNKPIQIMVGMSAGGGSDIGARIFAAAMEKQSGVPVSVVNKAGAGGQVGWTDFAKNAKPDGYNIALISMPGIQATVLNPDLKTLFTEDDFVPVVGQVVEPVVVLVRQDGPYKTMQDVVDDAKKRPGQVTATVNGVLNFDEIAYLAFNKATGVQMQVVRTDGVSQSITNLMGGHVDTVWASSTGAYSAVKSGGVRAVAVMAKERAKDFFPDVPTLKELGYGEIEGASVRGFAMPKGAPEALLEKIESDMLKVMKSEENVAKSKEAGISITAMNRKDFTDYYKRMFPFVKQFIGKQ